MDYIKSHSNICDLDREAICATIMDALVYKGLIDFNRESLDFDNLCICNDLEHYIYDSQPFVTSIPLSIKEKMREKCFNISGSIPASVFYAKPAGQVSFCIYDMNTVFSAFFDDFIFIDCDYDSPTREGKVATDRPFIEVSINGCKYLVDALTKRIFRSDLFRTRYHLKEKRSVSKSDFDARQQEIYAEHTMENVNYAYYIVLISGLPFPKDSSMAEMLYEFNMSKHFFSEEFEEAENIKKEMMNMEVFKIKRL